MALDTIVRKCMEKAPAMRYRSTRDLKQDLDRFLAGEPISATRYTRFQRFVQWCERKPTWAAVLFTLPLLMLGAYFSALFIGAVNFGVRLPRPAKWKFIVWAAVLLPPLAVFALVPVAFDLIAYLAIFLWLSMATAAIASVYVVYQSLETGVHELGIPAAPVSGELDLHRGRFSDLQRLLIMSLFFAIVAFFAVMAIDANSSYSWFAPTEPVLDWDDQSPRAERIREAKSLVGVTIKHRIERSVFTVPAAVVTVILGLAFGILVRIWSSWRLRTTAPEPAGEYLVGIVGCVAVGLCAQHLMAPIIIEHWRYRAQTPVS